ncbi:MAG: efflux transporter outer membrane subunit [Rhodanobacteraceae bacterium]
MHVAQSGTRILFGLSCSLLLWVSGCTVGPDFVRPTPTAPNDWTTWRSSDKSLHDAGIDDAVLQPDWWLAFDDPVLNPVQQRALGASPDLLTAALHVAEARTQRSTAEAQYGPDVNLNASVNRQRASELGAGVRLIDVLGADTETIGKLIAQPFNLYQAGFDASWEPDLWGRVRRSIEAADADVDQQAALLDMARLSVASDLARNYFELRTVQRQIALTNEDIALLSDRLGLLQSRVDAGVIDYLDLDRQESELEGLKARMPALLAQEGGSANRIALLVGEHPGALQDDLKPTQDTPAHALPDLALGVPAEIAERRPDIRAAEAELRAATASVGIAEAELYPAIRLGAKFGYESYLEDEFTDWKTRTWSIAPMLELPLFDHGRRRSVVELRTLQQQEAAISYHTTVLRAWGEIDDSLSGYTAEREEGEHLNAREHAARDAYELASAKYNAGAVDFLVVLDAQRNWLQARRERADSEGALAIKWVAVNKAIGNAPSSTQ